MTTLPQMTPPSPEVRRVQPYQAGKSYLCPGCNQDIPAGTGHVVVVPLETPDLRRHWHRHCGRLEVRRTTGGSDW